MPSSNEQARLAIRIECVSWRFVQHHLRHDALRFEDAALRYLGTLAPDDGQSRFCLATRVEDPIEVVGMAHYRLGADDLYLEHVLVRENYRRRDVARRMVTEIVTHPTCIRLSRIHWAAGLGGEALIRHLETLRDGRQRPCGTPFEVKLNHRQDAVGKNGKRE